MVTRGQVCESDGLAQNSLNGLRVAVIAKVLETLGYIEDAEAWLGG